MLTEQKPPCAKGSAGIMKQLSPAKLSKPLRRKAGAERGRGEFEEIEWDAALALLTERLAEIRASDPRKLAFFTGRDQMQALTGLWAQQFGTPNWAAHGGFCSVNMAAAGLYSIGYSFWEFDAPDFERAKYFLLWGVAEDHSSNPIKIGVDQLKRHGAKFVSISRPAGARLPEGARRARGRRTACTSSACPTTGPARVRLRDRPTRRGCRRAPLPTNPRRATIAGGVPRRPASRSSGSSRSRAAR